MRRIGNAARIMFGIDDFLPEMGPFLLKIEI
jgi:hypothetical protein